MIKFDRADKEKIRSYLYDDIKDRVKIITVDVTGSTNDDLKEAALRGEREITVLIAEGQSSGKGRLGKKFFSPKGSGCYMSILLRPSFAPESCRLLTPMAAVAVAKAAEKTTGVTTKIKWINDVYVEDKKAAGILTQASFSSGRIDYAVIGIGVNLSVPEKGFPDDIENIAGTIEGKTGESKNLLVGEILNNIIRYYDYLESRKFFGEYKSRLFILGKKITVRRPDKAYSATAVDLDRDFRLVVENQSGDIEYLDSGEISVQVN